MTVPAGTRINSVDADFPCFLAGQSVIAVSRDESLVVLKLRQTRKMGIDAEDDIPTAPAIATVWSALGCVFFAAEGHGAVAAISGANVDRCVID